MGSPFCSLLEVFASQSDSEIGKIHQKVASETSSKTSWICARCLIDLWRPGPSKTCLPRKREANLHTIAFSRKLTKTTSKNLLQSFQKRTQAHEHCHPKNDRKTYTFRKRFFSKEALKMSPKSDWGPPAADFFGSFSSIVLDTKK